MSRALMVYECIRYTVCCSGGVCHVSVEVDLSWLPEQACGFLLHSLV